MKKMTLKLLLAFTLIVAITGCVDKNYDYYSKKVPKIESQETLNEMLTEVNDHEKLNLTEKGKIMAIIAKQKAEIALENSK